MFGDIAAKTQFCSAPESSVAVERARLTIGQGTSSKASQLLRNAVFGSTLLALSDYDMGAGQWGGAITIYHHHTMSIHSTSAGVLPEMWSEY